MGSCRVCSKLNFPLQNIYEHLPGGIETVATMISSIVNNEISRDQGLSEIVCAICFEKIKIAYELKNQIEKSEALLKERFNDLSIKMENSFLIDYINDNSLSYNDEESFPVDYLEESSLSAESCQEFSSASEDDDEALLFFVPESKQSNTNDSNTKDLVGILLKDFDDINYKSESNCDDDYNSEFSLSLDDSDFLDFSDDELNRNKSNNNLDIDLIDEVEHECTMCHQSFINEEELKLHMKLHPKGTKHICKICSQTFEKSYLLTRHKLTHTEKKIKCSQCNKAFYNNFELKVHMIRHSMKSRLKSMKNYSCSLCNVKFLQRYMLVKHFQVKHVTRKENVDENSQNVQSNSLNLIDLECTMCFRRFLNIKTLREHKNIHPEGTKHFCKYCGRSYFNPIYLQRHLMTHKKKLYLCNYCGKSFTTDHYLKAHMVYHNEKRHKCSQCHKTFYRHYKLRDHIRIVHMNEKYNCICEICGKLCATLETLHTHKKIHNLKKIDDSEEFRVINSIKKKKMYDYVCNYCGETKHMKHLLEFHILSRHLHERRFICHICNKGFYSQYVLNTHMSVHNRTMNECDVCGKLLTNKHTLKIHKKLHTGEKPYACDICGQSFITYSRRKTHQTLKHGEKAVCCNLCPSKFYFRNELTKHMLTHVKEC